MNYRRLGVVMVSSGAMLGLFSGAALSLAPAKATTVTWARSTPRSPAHATDIATEADASPTSPPPLPASFSGDVQAVGVRIEADEPLPVGPGDLPSMTGQINSEEDFANATAAVDLTGAVVGPKVQDPTGDNHDYTQLPQATCLYPSQPNTNAQSYPFDGADQQTIQSETTCTGAPSATGMAYAAQIGGNAGVTNPTELKTLGLSALPLGIQAAVSGHESLGPDGSHGAVRVSADAEVNDFYIPGILHVDSIKATGWTEASGRPGGASTSAQVEVAGLTIGGATISVGPQGVQIGSEAPVPISKAGPLVQEFNALAGAVGCNLTLLTSPDTYPQGPLFARPPLPNRISPDGTDAGSTAAGAYVRCVVPQALNPTNFNPLILQVLLGFVGTEAEASTTTRGPQFGIGGSASGPGFSESLGSTTPGMSAGATSILPGGGLAASSQVGLKPVVTSGVTPQAPSPKMVRISPRRHPLQPER